MQAVVDDDVVEAVALKTFAQFQSAVQQQVVVNLVMDGAVVEINVPAVVAAPAVVPQRDRLHHVQQRRVSAVRPGGTPLQAANSGRGPRN